MVMDVGAIEWKHGGGGKATYDLTQDVFVPAFHNRLLDVTQEATPFTINEKYQRLDVARGNEGQRLVFTTETCAVSPLFFPGGDIGTLSVYNTLNMLATLGAKPLCLSSAFMLELGFPIATLQRVTQSMTLAAHGTPIIASDTQVVEHIVIRAKNTDRSAIVQEAKDITCSGKALSMLITVSGIGLLQTHWHGPAHPQPGDRIVVSGPVGEHGVAVMMARHKQLEQLATGDAMADPVLSDSTSLSPLIDELLMLFGDDIRCMKNPTSGGIAMALNEVAQHANIGIELEKEEALTHPDTKLVNSEVKRQCDLFRIKFLDMPSAGRMLLFVAPDKEDELLAAMHEHPQGRRACSIGTVVAEDAGRVWLGPASNRGRKTWLEMPSGHVFPYSC